MENKRSPRLLAVYIAWLTLYMFNPKCRGAAYGGGEDVPCYMTMAMVYKAAALLGLGLGFYYVQKLPAAK